MVCYIILFLFFFKQKKKINNKPTASLIITSILLINGPTIEYCDYFLMKMILKLSLEDCIF